METLIESLTGVSIKSPFFSDNPLLEFFPAHKKGKKNRIALLYGPNGSGKSTIAQGFVNTSTRRLLDLSKSLRCVGKIIGY